MPRDRFSKLLKASILSLGGMIALLALVLLAGLLVGHLVMVGKEHPTDAELETLLRTKRPQLDSLVRMIQDDRMEVVASDWIRPESGLSKARWDLYRGLFARLDLESGIRQYQTGTVEFLVSTQGLATGGSSKGIVRHLTVPDPILPSLDERPPGVNTGHGYKKIWDDWYIFYEWDD